MPTGRVGLDAGSGATGVLANTRREAAEPAVTLRLPHAVRPTLFFQLISRRYERGPMILTGNQSFGSWGDVFGDRVIASAILDRILHHATTISIRGDSYRLKDKLKSGVVKPTAASTGTRLIVVINQGGEFSMTAGGGILNNR